MATEMKELTYFAKAEANLLRWSHLGVSRLSNGTLLIGRVPHIAPQAWLHCIYPPPSPAKLAEMEARFGSRVPASYLELLSRWNGLSAFSVRLSVYGLRESFARRGEASWQPYDLNTPNTFERVPNAPPDAFFIGSNPGPGLRFALLAESGVVMECRLDDPRPIRTWPSLPEMIMQEIERLTALCDAEGRISD